MKTMLVFGFVALVGCSSQDKDVASAHPDTVVAERPAVYPPPPALWDSILASAPPMEPCEVSRHVALSIDSIKRWPLRITRGGDLDCRLAILDSLADGFIRGGESPYLEAMDSLLMWSDTEYAEAFSGYIHRMFDRRTSDLLRYLIARPDSPVEHELIDDWSSQLRVSHDSLGLRRQYLSTVRTAVPDSTLDVEERARLTSILRTSGLIE